jgi:hypothetical protein
VAIRSAPNAAASRVARRDPGHQMISDGRSAIASGASTGPRIAGAGAFAACLLNGLYPAEQKRVRELLTQSRELLKQMQAG